MPSIPPTSIGTRKRTRSNNLTENNHDHPHPPPTSIRVPTALTATSNSHSIHPTNTASANAPPKRQRNNPPSIGPPPPPPVAPRTTYSFRNRSLTPDPRHPLTRFPSVQTPAPRTPNRPRYNLRPRRPQSQVRLPQVSTAQPVIAPRRTQPLIPPINPPATAPTASASSSSAHLNQPSTLTLHTSTTLSSSSSILPPSPPSIPVPPVIPPIAASTPPVVQPRQYRLVYISDDDDEPHATPTVVNTTIDLVTDDDDDDLMRSQFTNRHRSTRASAIPGITTRFRTVTAVPSSAVSTSSSSSSSSSSTSTTINTQDFISGVAYIRLNRAIEIVIDSIQSLEGAVNSFDQLVFGLIYGRLGTRGEAESIENMIRLSRILNLNTMPARLTQDEIDGLPKINFVNKSTEASSILLVEKCPICLNEFNDQELINKLHCTHLFHLQCISTWLSENDSCPTCRRKVMGD